MNTVTKNHSQNTKLLDNILRFIRLLRKSGVKIGNQSSIDALKGIKILKIGSRKEFYWSLLDQVYPTFKTYRERADRDIPLIKFIKA